MRIHPILVLLLVLAAVPLASADEIDDYVRAEMTGQHIPGLSLCVVQHGRIVKSNTYGLADVELNVPVSADTEFSIASMTKSITASAIMLLVQDGKLTLDDHITKFFDGLPESWQPITIRHLLSHTSGIKDHFRDYPFYPPLKLDRKLEYTDEEYLKAHIDAGLNFTPGAQWAYCSSGYTLLGMIITKVTGKPYGDFFRDRIFTPLGMTKTHLISLKNIIPNRASGYGWEDGALRNGYYTGQTYAGAADVSVLTTSSDLAKWFIGLTSEGLWTKASLDSMWSRAKLSNGEDVAAFPSGSSGLGWALGSFNGYSIVGHGGSFITGFTSVMIRIPEKDLTVIVLTNQHETMISRIGYGIFGFFEPTLIAPHRRSAEPDSRPDLYAKMKAFTLALFSGAETTSFTTAELQKHRPYIPKLPAGKAPPITDFAFISSDDLRSRRIVRNGVKVVEARYYKMTFDGDPRYITFYLSEDGHIADYSGY